MKIGVFDSGVGGLTVLKELLKYKNEYYYFGDNINIPYGTKTKYELQILASKIVEFLISKEVDMIVIACGTVSSNVYEYLKNKYDISIYDIISPTLNYLKDKSYYAFATPMTCKSKIFDNAIECPLLVPLIESGKDATTALKDYLDKIPLNSNLVLGCTHYPILTNKILNIRPDLNLIDMGKVLCDSLNLESNKLKVRLYFSKVDHNLINNIEKIIDVDYQLEELCLNYQK